jgi:LacI family transcriptional regulator
MARRVTQFDIAEHLKIGRSTVSMALRDDPRITLKVRQRVRQAAQQLGYTPDPALAALASYRETLRPRSDSGHSLGFLYPSDYPKRSVSPKYPLIHGIGTRAAELGYHIEFFPTDYSEKQLRKTLQNCRARGIEGLFLNSPTCDIRPYRLDWSRLTSVTVGNTLRGTGFPLVAPDAFRGARLAMRELQQLGFQRPGLFYDRDYESRDFHIIKYGFLEGCHENFNQDHPPIYDPREHSRPFQMKKLIAWIRRHKIDVIIDSGRSQYRRHQEIKRDSGACYVSLDIPEENASVISGLKHNRYTIGRQATNLLDTYVRQRQFGVHELSPTLLIPPSWNPGKLQ